MDGESCRSESKVLVGQKRAAVEETSDSSHKRVKMRDLESVLRSEAQAGREGSNTLHPHIYSGSKPLDLNVKAVDLNLNAEDISSSINGPFSPHKKDKRLRLIDDSECESSVAPLMKGQDPMRAWKGLKQNNYMTNPYGSATMQIPKPRGRKKLSNDLMKKKIELVKKEQVDRFARVAAPSGLLNGLNPGIINHVRNSKQVHSIIEAIVRSERNENQLSGSKKGNQFKNGAEDMHNKGVNSALGLGHGVARGDVDSFMGPTRFFSRMPSQCDVVNEDDKLALKLSSFENNSCLSNDESANCSSVASLSDKAANVASQWLELLSQDIRGRLAALRRSKKRVRAVITTDLPLLKSREFSSNVDKDGHSARWCSLFSQMDKTLSEEESHLVLRDTKIIQVFLHLKKLSASKKSLSSQYSKFAEASDLEESWLNQVKEMQLHCENDVHINNLYHASQQARPVGNETRPLGAVDNSEKDLAVRAAAASIYSTCNFLLSMEKKNPPCC